MTLERWSAQLEAATSLSDIEAFFRQLTKDLGCDYFAAFSIADAPGTEFQIESLDNAPKEYEGFSDPTRGPRDPVMQFCKRSSLPISWNRNIYSASNLLGMYDEQAEFGYRSGVCVAIHMPNHRHFVLGVERNADGLGTPAENSYLQSSVVMSALRRTTWHLRSSSPGESLSA